MRGDAVKRMSWVSFVTSSSFSYASLTGCLVFVNLRFPKTEVTNEYGESVADPKTGMPLHYAQRQLVNGSK